MIACHWAVYETLLRRCRWTRLTPCRQYEPLRNSLISCSSVRREMWVVPTVTWVCPPTAMGLWVEVKASSLTGGASSCSMYKDISDVGVIGMRSLHFSSSHLCAHLTSLVSVGVLKGGFSCSSCSLSNWASRWGRRGEPARAWQKMAFTGEDLNLQGIHAKFGNSKKKAPKQDLYFFEPSS